MSRYSEHGTFYVERRTRNNIYTDEWLPPFFIRYFSGMGLSSTNLKNITLWDCKSWVDGRIAIRNPSKGRLI